jgi:hypothetical protein
MSAIVKKESHGLTVAQFNKQVELLAKFELPSTAIERYYVRVDKKNDGSESYTLCKRNTPIKIYEIDEEANRVVAGMQSYSERIGFSKNRGKYNDEHKLDGANSIEVGEVEAWATI